MASQPDLLSKHVDQSSLKKGASPDTSALTSSSPKKRPCLSLNASPIQQIGCLLVVAVLVALVVLTIKSVQLPTSLWPQTESLQPADIVVATKPPAVATGLPLSPVILGRDSVGRTCYYDQPTGVLCRAPDTKTLTFAASLPDFDTFHWSESRAKIAFVRFDEAYTHPWLYVLDLDNLPGTQDIPMITTNTVDRFPAGFGLRPDSQIAWSPHEGYIAFNGYDAHDRVALFVCQIESQELRQLNEGADPVISVQWETEGTDERIVYALVQDGQQRLYTIKPDGADNKPWHSNP